MTIASTTPQTKTPLALMRGQKKTAPRLRRFYLLRHNDPTGVSGTGIVAEGVRYSNGTVSLQWLREPGALSVFASVGDMLSVHGHGGSTEIQWMDSE